MASPPVKRERPAYPWGPPRKHRRRWRRWLVYGCLALMLLVLAAPTIVGHTPLLNILLANVLEPDQGQLTAGGASVGWFSSLAINQVKIHDPQGQVLAAIDSIQIDRSLLGLLQNRTDLGTIRIDRPQLHILFEETRSNLEDFLAPWLQSRESKPIDVQLEIQDGTVVATDQKTDASWHAEAIRVSCSLARSKPDSATRIALDVQTTVPSPGGEPGNIAVTFTTGPEEGTKIDCQATAVPIDSVAGIGRRLGFQGIRLGGRLGLQATAAWSFRNPADLALETAGRVTVSEWDVSGPALGADRIQLQQMDIPWQIRLDNGRLYIHQLDLESEVGSMAVEGSAALADWAVSAGDSTGKPGWLAGMRQPINVRGQIDLARLAAMLPATLRIREGTTVTSGRAQFELHSMAAGPGHLWSGELKTSAIAARNADTAWIWDQPVHLQFAVRNDNGWKIEAARCESDFFEVSMTGDWEHHTIQATCDLNRLVDQLGQFVDWSGWELAGRGQVLLEGQAQAGTYQVDSKAFVESLRIAHDGTVLLHEPRLDWNTKMSGTWTDNRPRTCDRASVEILAGTDVFRAQLLEPVVFPEPAGDRARLAGQEPDPSRDRKPGDRLDDGPAMQREPKFQPDTAWVFDLKCEGRLPDWRARIEPWYPLTGWEFDGTSQLTAQVEIGSNGIRIGEATWTLTDLRAASSQWRIEDPQVTWQLHEARYDPIRRQARVGEAIWTSASVAGRGRDLTVAWASEGGLRASGSIDFRALLQRLDGYRMPTANTPPTWRYTGDTVGQLQVITRDRQTTIDVNTVVERLALYALVPASAEGPAGYRTAWQTPKVQLAGKVVYDPPGDRIQIDSAQLQSETLVASVTGSVANLSATRSVQIQGAVEYDLAQWTPVVATYLGPDVHLTGRDRATFALAGTLPPFQPAAHASASPPGSRADPALAAKPGAPPHWSQTLQGSASAGWQQIDLYGLPVSAGRIETRLANGAIRCEPFQVAVGEGNLSLALQARFDPGPETIYLPQGRVLDRIHVTPEVSDRFLKFIAPVLDKATDSEGAFSLSLAEGRIPIGNPERAAVTGQLQVHSVRVMPGPMARQLIQFIEQIGVLLRSGQTTPTWLTIQDRTIDFRVAEGRVYHQGLEFSVGEVTVRSSGTVGFDESLNLSIAITLPDAWIAREPFLRGLQGQTIDFVVRGTFSKPQIDREALREIARRIGRSAAQGAIQEGIGHALDQLLKPRE